MRYTAELAQRAEAWLARPLVDKRSAAGLLELSTIWAATQGLPYVPTCAQCQYSDRVHDLNAYLREYARFTSPSAAMSDTQTTSKYQFVPAYAGQTLTSDSYNKAVTADNLTDEDAEYFSEHGYAHVFQQVAEASESAPAQAGATDEAPAGNPDLVAEQHAHAVTKQALTDEKEHGKQALKAEKEAHKATKKELTEVSKQLADAQKQLAKLADAAQHAAGDAEQSTTDGEANAAR